MSKVTGKLQETVPKVLADRYAILPGDDIRFEEAGENIRIVLTGTDSSGRGLDVDARLRLFDAATARQRKRESGLTQRRSETRGWTREALYEHGRSRVD